MPYQQVGDCSVFYEDIGVGQPVLFLHSSYSRGIIAFGGQIQPFFHSYRCLLPDFRGHGRTKSEKKDWDTSKISEDMAGFLAALGIEKAHIIGYSLGGGVALHLAAKYPDLIQSITTIGCGGVADPTGADDFEPEALIRNNQQEFIERIKVIHGDAHGGDWEHHLRQSAKDWREYPNLSEEDWTKLTMPMLLIGGEKDIFASRDKLQNMKKRCPQAEIYIVPGASHRPHMPTEQVKEVNTEILNFLKRIRG
ncbi:alpha/beta hydrolase [Anaerocolumna sp. AGMB13025]|uniref:alpha/beta fold hydrolase n=1 Tax=Anaerocolumna sp. AGMB13025 TaxID=3039116 RepID=UPI00241EFC23|nr:alpha/beta hydrolase [Anaerocolumna sp. AGMB13025]WFR56665.1 alpha/beta hydrolase [Anaerocolumna sp. AGMB13025]